MNLRANIIICVLFVQVEVACCSGPDVRHWLPKSLNALQQIPSRLEKLQKVDMTPDIRAQTSLSARCTAQKHNFFFFLLVQRFMFMLCQIHSGCFKLLVKMRREMDVNLNFKTFICVRFTCTYAKDQKPSPNRFIIIIYARSSGRVMFRCS